MFHTNFKALRYEESYQQALDSYQRSVALDPSFLSAKQQLQQLLQYLPQVYENVVRKVIFSLKNIIFFRKLVVFSVFFLCKIIFTGKFCFFFIFLMGYNFCSKILDFLGIFYLNHQFSLKNCVF